MIAIIDYSIAYFSCSTDYILHIDQKKKTESRCVDENNYIFNPHRHVSISYSEFSACGADGSAGCAGCICTYKIMK